MLLSEGSVIGSGLITGIGLFRSFYSRRCIGLRDEQRSVVVAWGCQSRVAVKERIAAIACRLEANSTLQHLKANRFHHQRRVVSVVDGDRPHGRYIEVHLWGLYGQPLFVDPMTILLTVNTEEISGRSYRLLRLGTFLPRPRRDRHNGNVDVTAGTQREGAPVEKDSGNPGLGRAL